MPLVQTSSSDKWKTIKEKITAGSTLDIDKVDFNNSLSIKYIINIRNISQDVYFSCEILATRTSNNGLQDTLHSPIGDKIDVDIEVIKNVSDIFLHFQNNETFDLDIIINRLLVTI